MFLTNYKEKHFIFSDDIEDLSQYRPSSIRQSFYTSADTYASVYKSKDDGCTHNEAIDNYKDRGNKVRAFYEFTSFVSHIAFISS